MKAKGYLYTCNKCNKEKRLKSKWRGMECDYCDGAMLLKLEDGYD